MQTCYQTLYGPRERELFIWYPGESPILSCNPTQVSRVFYFHLTTWLLLLSVIPDVEVVGETEHVSWVQTMGTRFRCTRFAQGCGITCFLCFFLFWEVLVLFSSSIFTKRRKRLGENGETENPDEEDRKRSKQASNLLKAKKWTA
ncbi:hypothetical protein V6N11_010905 [Hibiscus sabdariffa]|uniref:Uncharacterized protein n=1 Tax=Hibiscus sabdariffa TaxID=183260 RepID=A0ABR2S6U3_9ROSI